MSASGAALTLEWEAYEGGHTAYDATGAQVIGIDALQDPAYAAKWGDPYTPGRGWTVYHEDGTLTHGHSADLRAARKDAIAALEARR